MRGIPCIHGNQHEAVERASQPQKKREGDSVAVGHNTECPTVVKEVIDDLSIAALIVISNKKVRDKSRWLSKQGREVLPHRLCTVELMFIL